MTQDNGPRPLKLRVGFRTRTVHGGPAKEAPTGGRGFAVDLKGGLPENGASVDWPDFGLPHEVELQSALYEALRALVNGRPLYVGCGWGRGRTGTFLALLAKILGHKCPVLFVRTNYLAEAVETPEQKKFVEEYNTSELRGAVKGLLRARRRGFYLREV